jgi:hypothetical protein
MNITNINDLPNEISNQPLQHNIGFNVKEHPSLQPIDTKLSGGGGESNVSLDQNTINLIVSGLQQASTTGVTQLQSRDIPINKTQFMDEQTQQEYIPSANVKNDFIEEEDEEEDNSTMINNYNKRISILSRIENTYTDLQIPILISILYFIFQLPFFKSVLFKNIPFLFFSDGNINIYGQLFMSVLFGIIYYICSILLKI